jgi:hypothetical protein
VTVVECLDPFNIGSVGRRDIPAAGLFQRTGGIITELQNIIAPARSYQNHFLPCQVGYDGQFKKKKSGMMEMLLTAYCMHMEAPGREA